MAAFSPQFCRNILHTNLEDRKLMVPKKFVKYYGEFMRGSSVRLKLPDGMEWKVGLTTAANGVVWLQKDWHQVVEHYGLEAGSFLVFRLHGNSTFQTTIFDPTGLETEYSCSNFRPDFEHRDSGFDSDECLEKHSKKRRRASSIPCRHSRKKLRKRSEDSLPSPKIEPDEEGYNVLRDRMPSSKNLRMPKDPEIGVSRRRQQSANDKAEAAATQRFSSKSKSKSKSEKQPTFKVVMAKSNVRGRFDLFFPKEFAEKYLSDEFGMMKLQTSSKGRHWPVLYKWSRNRGIFAYISSGWKGFVEENRLKEGDIGLFELIKEDTILFTKLQQETTPLPKKRIVTAKTTKKPFFEVDILFRSYKNFSLNIPLAFAREHLSPQMKSATLKVGNKQWNVTLKQYESSVRFSAGWCFFYDDNGLEDRDTCFFEMVNTKDCVFEVTIFKKLTRETD